MAAFFCLFVSYSVLENETSRQAFESFCAYTLKVAEYTCKLSLTERNKIKSHVNKIDSVLVRMRKTHCDSMCFMHMKKLMP